MLLYAALSLTLIRMIPVAIAFAGQGVQRPTVAFIGWFGPRGLASLVFGLIALERGVPEGEVVLTTVVVTVALSVTLHGLTAGPLADAYHRWYERHTTEHPVAAEATAVRMPRRRRRFPGGDPSTRGRDDEND
ncbi:sodium/hydrogen exchanger family protein [Nesterenkonia sandarakina]|uniref:Sodium/hydrogen exchanger family protein n=1 Tax=Nesterenkonia sandarakina TaxID=272918 RepID=A0A2T0YGS2_9MICC|nr:sodium/hydrogen exchanger family protein [Nesterenkonia sandarakina]